MIRTLLILSIAAMPCLLLSEPVHSQKPGGRSDVRARVAEAELDVKMQDLELKMSELAVDEATIEHEKIKLHLESAQAEGNSHEVGHTKFELKQAAIRVEMRKVQFEMSRLQIQRAKAGLEHLRAALNEKPGKRSRVRLEFVDDLDGVVIRGAKEDVERIRALLEGAEIKKKGSE